MEIVRWAVKEMLYRKLNYVSGLLAVLIAVGSLVGAMTLLNVHEAHTQQILDDKEEELKKRVAVLNDEMRKSTLKLSFNMFILPKDQDLRNWYADDLVSKYMPEEYVERLANSRIITVRHLLPTLQQRVEWEEKKRRIILIGTRGEVPKMHKAPRAALVQPVPDGEMVVGYELHQSLGLNIGDTVQLLGREFTVHKCHEERGSKDDITVWIPLREAQELLGKKGLINGILALECLCTGRSSLEQVRSDVQGILPDTQVVELTSRVLARAEIRLKVAAEGRARIEGERESRTDLYRQWEYFASILAPLVIMACAVWIAILGFVSVRDRRIEIGILRALGFRSGQIVFLFLSKSVFIGLTGGVLGFLTGVFSGNGLAVILEGDHRGTAAAMELFDPILFLSGLVAALAITVAAGLIPALTASQQDPAEILRGE